MQIDDLEYTYHPVEKNRLAKVVDIEANSSGFSDSADNNVDDYAYDAFGNMVSDRNKNIRAISYNHLNLPVTISIGAQLGNYSQYTYTASGVKVRNQQSAPGKFGPTTNTTDYLGGFQYYNNVLQHFPTAEGYVQHTVSGGVSSYRYIYHYKDHLGNNRVSYAFDAAENRVKILEENHYYPFGYKHFGYNEDSYVTIPYSYRYNGKEDIGLGMYDYGARHYDPSLGRWFAVDPLAEISRKYSPYTYAYNNPIRFTDPDGMANRDEIDTGIERSYNVTDWFTGDNTSDEGNWADAIAYNGPTADNQQAIFRQNFSSVSGAKGGEDKKDSNNSKTEPPIHLLKANIKKNKVLMAFFNLLKKRQKKGDNVFTLLAHGQAGVVGDQKGQNNFWLIRDVDQLDDLLRSKSPEYANLKDSTPFTLFLLSCNGGAADSQGFSIAETYAQVHENATVISFNGYAHWGYVKGKPMLMGISSSVDVNLKDRGVVMFKNGVNVPLTPIQQQGYIDYINNKL